MSDANRLLAEWQDKLAVITQNANALYEAEFSLRIRNRLREGRYSGQTAQRAERAVAKLTALMDDYLVLARLVDEAAEVNKGSFLQAREVTEARVLDLLLGYSVELPTVHVPLPKRDLLTDANHNQRARPSELLAAMQQAFAEARDGLGEIDRAETVFQERMAWLQAEASRLAALADALAVEGGRPDMAPPTQTLADPLQTLGRLNEMRQALGAWQQRLAALAAERDAAVAAMTAAQAEMAQLEALEAQRLAGIAAASELFGDEASSELSAALPARLVDLKQWLATLSRTLAERQWQAAKMGLTRFAAAQADLRTSLLQASRRATQGVDEYADLTARFKALRFKAQAMGLDGEGVRSAEATIQTLYRARPVVLAQLREQVQVYERYLIAQPH